jgi:hypothetical protein
MFCVDGCYGKFARIILFKGMRTKDKLWKVR